MKHALDLGHLYTIHFAIIIFDNEKLTKRIVMSTSFICTNFVLSRPLFLYKLVNNLLQII